MISFPLFGDDQKQDSPLNKIIQGAMGKVKSASEAPTTANGLISEGEVGYFNLKVYFTVDGKTYSVPATLV